MLRQPGQLKRAVEAGCFIFGNRATSQAACEPNAMPPAAWMAELASHHLQQEVVARGQARLQNRTLAAQGANFSCGARASHDASTRGMWARVRDALG